MKKINLYRTSVVLSSVLLIISLIYLSFLGISVVYIAAVLFSMIFLIVSVFRMTNAYEYENKVSAVSFIAGRIFIFMVMAFLIFGIVSPIKSFFSWQYSFDKAYLQKNGYECTYFPENLPDNTDEYYFEFLPSIMQGSGYVSMSFTAESEIIDEYIAEYESKSIEIFTLEEYDQGDHNILIMSKAFNDEDFSDTVVYLVYANHSWNHPHTKCVMINKRIGKIEFFEV